MKKFYSITLILACIFLFSIASGNVLATEENIDSETTETKETVIEDENETETKSEKESSDDTNKTETDTTTKTDTSTGKSKSSSSSTKKTTDTTTTTTTTLSSNNFLKSLTLNVDGMTPSFNKKTNSYSVEVPLEIKNIEVNAIAEDTTANVVVDGNANLAAGKSTILITVTAENGSVRTYKIEVVRTVSKTDADLKDLNIEGYTIDFDSQKSKYNIDISDDITKLKINATTENEKASYEIEGNEDLTYGENKITIKVTAEDGTTQKEYTIYAVKGIEKVEVAEQDELFELIILGVCSCIFLVCFIVLIVRSKKKF